MASSSANTLDSPSPTSTSPQAPSSPVPAPSSGHTPVLPTRTSTPPSGHTPVLPTRTSSASVTEHILQSQLASPPVSAASSISSASGPIKQRNRRGILTRQHSAQSASQPTHSPNVSNTNSPSLSPSSSRSRLADDNNTDDDGALTSDSAPMPRRFAANTTAAPSRGQQHPSSSLESIVMFNRASPLASATSSLGGGKGADSHSPSGSAFLHSRPTIPAPMRFASNSSRSSIHSSDASETASYQNDAMSHLSRAKSISSVSSVTSTSSMEAAPFRAAPMGNIRMSYVGGPGGPSVRAPSHFAIGVGVPQRVSSYGTPDISVTPRVMTTRTSTDGDMDDFVRAANAAAAAANSTPAMTKRDQKRPESQQPQPTSITRAKGHNPKTSSDEWQYRNAPGTGAKLGGRPIPGSYRNLNELRQSAANHLQSRGIGVSVPPEAGPSHAVQQQPTKRPTQALRSKLAKSASRLGLKPLTIVPGATVPHPRVAADFVDSASTTSEELDVEQDLISSATGAALLDPRRNNTAVNNGFLTPVPQSAHEYLVQARMSAVTNAPLIVPKLSPVLDASPGLYLPASPGGGVFGSHNLPSPHLTPTRLAPDHLTEKSSHGHLPALAIPNAAGLLVPPSRPSSLRAGPSERDLRKGKREMKHTSLSPPSTPQATSLAFTWSNTGSLASGSAGGSSPSRGSQLPSPSPAELVRMEAQAGVATLPTEGSGSTPGPTPTICADDDNIPIARLPDQQTSPTKKRGSGAGDALVGLPFANLLPRRPMFRRTKTNESLASKHSESSLGKTPRHQGATTGTAAPPTDADVHALQSYSMVAPADAASRPTSVISSGSDGLALGAEAPSIAQANGGAAKASPPRQTERLRMSSNQASPAAGASSVPRFPPFPMQRIESAATAVSKAVSDTSDFNPPVPIKSPPRQVAGKISTPELKFDGIEAGEGVQMSPRLDIPLQKPALCRAPPAGSEQLGPIAERSPDGRSPGVSPGPPPLGETQEGGAGAAAEHAKAMPPPAPLRSASPAPPASTKPDEQPSRGLAKPRGKDDFEFGDVLGEGSYSTVMLAWDLLSNPSATADGKPPKATVTPAAAMAGAETEADPWIRQNMKAYAIKVLDKIHILKERKQKYVGVEKEALSLLIRHPGVINLYWTFQDAESLYFVLELAENGELLTYIKQYGSFDQLTTRYYAAQLLETIAGMHRAGVIHRDIKPENVLLTSSMRTKVTDFGSAKILHSKSKQTADDDKRKERERASSFVGTAEYVSPELLTDKAASEASDFWAFGCVVFQMLTGRPPFKASSEYQTFQKIIKRDVDFPAQLSPVARDLIDRLLVLDPAERLGTNGVEEIKSHPFFEGVEWGDRLWKMDAPKMVTGIQAPVKREEVTPSPHDMFGTDNMVQDDEFSEGDEDEGWVATAKEQGAAVQFPAARQGSSNTSGDDSDESSPPPSLRSGHADADDDASSLSDSARPPPRRRGLSAGAGTSERMGPSKRASALFRIAASVTGQQDKSATVGRSTRGSTPTHGFQATSNGMYLNWAALLLPHEAILYASPVIHRKTGTANLQSKRRMLILTDFPRLLCVKEDAAALKVKSETLLALPAAGTGPSASTAAAAMNRGQSWGGLSEAGAAATSEQAQEQAPRMVGSNAISAVSSASASTAGPPLSTNSTSTPPRHLRRDSVPILNSTSGNTNSSNDVLMQVEQKSTRTFIVQTPLRAYTYEDPSGDASHWVRSIRAAIGKVRGARG